LKNSACSRFALTSFLVTVGMPPEKVAEVFKSFSDYNERLRIIKLSTLRGKEVLERVIPRQNVKPFRPTAFA
jgi:DNA primase large subunit